MGYQQKQDMEDQRFALKHVTLTPFYIKIREFSEGVTDLQIAADGFPCEACSFADYLKVVPVVNKGRNVFIIYVDDQVRAVMRTAYFVDSSAVNSEKLAFYHGVSAAVSDHFGFSPEQAGDLERGVPVRGLIASIGAEIDHSAAVDQFIFGNIDRILLHNSLLKS